MTLHPPPGSGTLQSGTDSAPALRARRMDELGLREAPDPELDAFTDRLAADARAAWAMVNLLSLDGRRQYFPGLHNPDSHSDLPIVGRSMPMDTGFCPELLKRTPPHLVLPDLYAAPQLTANPVVQQIGARLYVGARLTCEKTGITLGALCYLDVEPRPETAAASYEELDRITTASTQLMDLLYERERAAQ
ncbi:GAF domain-containing protein [Streptomyces sp. NPDC056244]|uniref:GAF domain-containing protein n=1 Tax=Streptomyces sp. NPDC056244 TaxID=3345762 RepID=UPI0035DA02F8